MANRRSPAPEPPILEPPAAPEVKGQGAPPAPQPTLRICATCAVWDRLSGRRADGSFVAVDSIGEFGACRARAPIPLTLFGKVQEIGPLHVAPALWPTTFAGENCGEWRESDNA